MSSLNVLVNNLFDSSFRTAVNLGSEMGSYLPQIAKTYEFGLNIGRYVKEIAIYPIKHPLRSVTFGYILLQLTGCAPQEEKPPEPKSIVESIPTPSPTTTPVPSLTYTFIENNGECELREEELPINSMEKENNGHDGRVVRIKNAFGGYGIGYQISLGLIMTKNHIIKGEGKLRVYYQDGSSLEGDVESKDPLNDLALVKVPRSTRELDGEVRFRSNISSGEIVEVRSINPKDDTYKGLSNQINFLIINIGKGSITVFEDSKFKYINDNLSGMRYKSDIIFTPGMSGSIIIDGRERIAGNLTTGGAYSDKYHMIALTMGLYDPFELTAMLKKSDSSVRFYAGSPEPSVIVNFLQDYCNKTKAGSDAHNSEKESWKRNEARFSRDIRRRMKAKARM